MNKRTQDTLVLVGLGAAMVTVSLMLVQLPQRRKLADLKTQIAAQTAQLKAHADSASTVPALLNHVQEMRDRYGDFDRRLPKSRELFAFLEEISQTVRDVQLDSQGIQPATPVKEDLYHTLPIILRVRGTYAELIRFLNRIDQIERLTRVQRLDIQTSPRDQDLTITMFMNIYFTEK